MSQRDVASLVPKAVRAEVRERRRMRHRLKRAFVWGSRTCPADELARRVARAEALLNGTAR